MGQLTLTPDLIVAFTGLVTAIATLIKVLQHSPQITQTAAKVDQIEKNTNGTMAAVVSQNAALQATQATTGELAARTPDPAPAA